jgi:nicotinamidase-related amidase
MSSQDEPDREIAVGGEVFDPGAQAINRRWGDETDEFYRARGFATRVGYGTRPAVLVIDMTRALCDPSFKVGCDQTAAIEAIARLLDAARAAAIPVYYTTVAYLPDGRDGGVFVRKIPALIELQLTDRAATEIEPRIAPVEGEVVIEKKYPSAFFGTSLGSMLVSLGVDTLVLTGCSTSGCIRATAIDAVSHGYRVIVPVEAVSDRAPGPHYANLFDINAKYGDVVPLAEVLDHFSGASVDASGRSRSRAL